MKIQLLAFIMALTFSMMASASLFESWEGMKEEVSQTWEETKKTAGEISEDAKEVFSSAKEMSAEKIEEVVNNFSDESSEIEKVEIEKDYAGVPIE